MFGALRFGAAALNNVARDIPGNRWIWLGACAAISTWASLDPYALTFTWILDFTARCVGCTSALITSDFLMKRRWIEPVARVDWEGCFAILGGLATPPCLRWMLVEFSPSSCVLPAYLTTLVVCASGPALQRLCFKSSELP